MPSSPTNKYLLDVPRETTGLATNASLVALATAINRVLPSLAIKSSPGMAINRDASGQSISITAKSLDSTTRTPGAAIPPRSTGAGDSVSGGGYGGGSGGGSSFGSSEFTSAPTGNVIGPADSPSNNINKLVTDPDVILGNTVESTLELVLGAPETSSAHATIAPGSTEQTGYTWICPPKAGDINGIGQVSAGPPTGEGFSFIAQRTTTGGNDVCDYMRRIQHAYSVTTIVVHETAAPSQVLGDWATITVPGFGTYRGQLNNQSSTLTTTIPAHHRSVYKIRTWLGTKGVPPA